MKRIIVAAVMLACIIAVSVAEHFVIDDVYNKTSAAADRVAALCLSGDLAAAKAQAAALEADWTASERRLSLFLYHADINELGAAVARLAPLCEPETKADALSECRLILVLLLHIRNSERLIPANVF